ncbi:NlpC/P60 family protein [Lentzea albida]|uniref:Transglycosylase SLT domain-containing protein n=1 Tax=Lentzea albida TaxID=65499 RepID=A0A1H9X171_9PSEU|nr:NlpC/P60 family protein [Lentzea albida]SES39880.1 Transglycosylase SLT domain-containing protein [Lentzea albida]
MMAKAAAVVGTVLLVAVLAAAGVVNAVSSLFGSTSSGHVNCAKPVDDIPPSFCALYIAAARVCPGLDWSVLAAIGKIETDHARLKAPGVSIGENFAGAGGPMQFLEPTFAGVLAHHTIPSGGATPPSRYNPHDAIHAAAFYLCDSGAPRDLYKAIFAYNHADWYVRDVLAQARKYAESANLGSGNCTEIRAVTPAARAAIEYACTKLGLDYVWGGDGETEGGFDCSGLTKAAYNAAGVELPRTAHTQYNAGPVVPAGETLLPGDLVFYGTSRDIHHVGLYIGAGQMIHAPTFGQVVQVGPYRWTGDDYYGATRPHRPVST